MTVCRDVDRLATAYVDGELDDRRSSAVRGHLRVCPRCAERVEDEVRLRELAADLEPVDPPQDMWQSIDARLAEAEIDDSQRSRGWLLLQRAIDTVRRNAALFAVGAAAAAVLLILWLPRSGGDDREASPAPRGASPARAAPAQPRGDAPACGGAPSHEELVLCQMHESDRRYLDAIAELTRSVAEERASWSAADASRFDSAVAELDRAAAVERLRLAGPAGAAAGPGGRDPLHAIYRAKIELLSGAVVAGDMTGAGARRGAP